MIVIVEREADDGRCEAIRKHKNKALSDLAGAPRWEVLGDPSSC